TAACAQVPARQTSVVQVLPSSHWASVVQPVHAGTVVWVQPLAARQPSVVHGLPSSQMGTVPAWQTPAPQLSTPLQALPSSQVTWAQEQPWALTSALAAVAL